MEAEIFALLTALFLSMGSIALRKGLLRNPSPFVGLLMFSVSTIVLIVFLLIRGFEVPEGQAILFFMLRGVLDPGLAPLLLFVAFARLGATVTVPILVSSPIVSTTLSVIFLGESLSTFIVLGTALVIIGAAVLAISGNHHKIHRKYLIMAVGGMILIGFANVVAKLGFNQSDTPVEAMAIAFTTALVVIFIMVSSLNKWKEIPTKWADAKFFVIAGILAAIGLTFSMFAISKGDVSVVGPLFGAQPVFVLVWSYFLLKEHEKITKFVILGTLLIVGGVAFLTIA